MSSARAEVTDTEFPVTLCRAQREHTGEGLELTRHVGDGDRVGGDLYADSFTKQSCGKLILSTLSMNATLTIMLSL